MALTPRQQREIDYHRARAAEAAADRMRPVNFDVIESEKRRPHNAFWSLYDRILAHDLKGKRVLVAGCGFGEDAIRLARLGALVDAFDLSPESIDFARRRCATFGYGGVNFSVAPCETTPYDANSFDAVVLVDILHHVDIAATMAELSRILRPGGRVFGDELYTHSFLQKNIRESFIVRRVLHPAMRRLIYGPGVPYVTEDERKIDENEFRLCENVCGEFDADWFNFAVGRLAPDRWPLVSELDRAAMKLAGRAGRFVAGRVVFEGVIRKT
jgi:2-polyprenyl-3-methyl-5-hydroxy-6-metoxy-1,4-benzoquinol methylase